MVAIRWPSTISMWYFTSGCAVKITRYVLSHVRFRSIWIDSKTGYHPDKVTLFLPSATVVAERLCFYICLSVILFTRRRLADPQADPAPPQRPLQRTVLILLECILVLNWRTQSKKAVNTCVCRFLNLHALNISLKGLLLWFWVLEKSKEIISFFALCFAVASVNCGSVFLVCKT